MYHSLIFKVFHLKIMFFCRRD